MSMLYFRINTSKCKEISSLIAGFTVCGVVLGIGIIFFLISVSPSTRIEDVLKLNSQGKFTSEYYFRMGVTSIGGATTFAALIWAGQSIENIVICLLIFRQIEFLEKYT